MNRLKNKEYVSWAQEKIKGRPAEEGGPPAAIPFVLPGHHRLLDIPRGHRWRRGPRDESEFCLLTAPNGQPVVRLHSDLAENEINFVLR